MARFRATIVGNRGEASRLGTGSSGLRVTANGWHGGVTVIASACEVPECGGDVFTARATGGSGYGGAQSNAEFTFCSGKQHKQLERKRDKARRDAALQQRSENNGIQVP